MKLLLKAIFTSVQSLMFISAVLLLTVMVTGSAMACTICVPVPTKTKADFIIDAESVVLARENPSKPFSFLAIDTLKGSIEDPEINLFLNSAMRRRLANNSQHAAVLVRRNSNENWRNLGYANEETERVVREIIESTPGWTATTIHSGNNPTDWFSQAIDWGGIATYSPKRIDYFASLLGHSNRDLHELAYLEVGQAPYSMIGSSSASWPVAEVRAMLNDPSRLEWYPLAILMLGFHGEESDRDYIRHMVGMLEQFGSALNLSAWVSAYIETEGEEAIDQLEALYYKNKGRKIEELDAVTAAMSIHGSNGRTDLRNDIVEAYGTLLANHPRMASQVARDLRSWNQSKYVDTFRDLLAESSDSDPLGAYAIKLYLASTDK